MPNSALARTGGGSGNAVGPSSSTDNAVARFDGTTGKTLQNSLVTIDDNGSITLPTGQIISEAVSGAVISYGAATGGPKRSANYGDGMISIIDDLNGLPTGANTFTWTQPGGEVTCLGNAVTGSGSFVLATSPTLTTPTLTGMKGPVRALTASATLAATDVIVTIDATAGDVTLTLLAASAAVGRMFRIKRLDASANAVTIARAGADTIDGATSTTLTAQYQAKDIGGLTTTTWGIF